MGRDLRGEVRARYAVLARSVAAGFEEVSVEVTRRFDPGGGCCGGDGDTRRSPAPAAPAGPPEERMVRRGAVRERMGEEDSQGICVCEFVECFGMGQSRVSYYLARLREAGLVREERRGKWSYYSLERGVFAGLLSGASRVLLGGEGS